MTGARIKIDLAPDPYHSRVYLDDEPLDCVRAVVVTASADARPEVILYLDPTAVSIKGVPARLRVLMDPSDLKRAEEGPE